MTVSLRNEPEFLFRMFDTLGSPVFLVDHNGKILFHNMTASLVFQYSGDDLSGRAFSELLTADRPSLAVRGKISSYSEQIHGEESYVEHSETTCRKKNGATFIAQISCIPYNERNQDIVVIQDISDRKKLYQRATQRTKELSIFNAFARILTSHSNTEHILQETVNTLFAMLEADACWIYLFDESTGDLSLNVQRGFSDEFLRNVRRFKPGECFNGKVFRSGRPLLVKNASEDPRICHKDAQIKSVAGVPISCKGIIFGVLGVGSHTVSYFTSMDIQLLSTIGSQLGVALENAQLIGELNEKMKQIEVINELSSMVNSSLSIGTVFRIMMSEISKLISYDRGSILLYNETDNNLIIFALDTDMKTVLKKGVKAPLGGTSAGWVIKNNQPFINYDLESEMLFPLDRKLLDESIRSTISIPLFQDRTLGVFNLDSTEPSKYSDKDLQTLIPVAKHISIALENALLFEEISREKKEWQRTFDAITDMVWIEDGRHRVLRANRTLLMKTGLSAFQVTGKECREIFTRIGLSPPESPCMITIDSAKPSFREIKGTAGNIFHFWTYPLIDDEGRLYAIVHYLKDVTSQKYLEQQLIRSDKLASLGTLVAGIAHEINNPLGIIAGYSEALLDRAKDKSLLKNDAFEDFPEYLETIHSEIFRSKGILSSLLAFSRPSGRTFREIDINELIKEVILLVNHRAKRLRHNIELKSDRDLPKICAEPGSLRQLFMNIIINSMYFTPEGGSITIQPKLEFYQNTEVIKTSITDTGSGIPDEVIDRIFDPFFTTKPVGEGTGLGLSICHKIVDEHGGSIDVESKKDKGTSFIIRIPTKIHNGKNSCS